MNAKTNLDPLLQPYVEGLKQQSTTKSQDEAMQQRLMSNIENYSETQESASNGKRESSSGNMFGFFSRRPGMAKLAFAGSFSFACVLAVGLYVSGGVTSSAFANVAQTLARITSMHYEGRMISNGQEIMQLQVFYQAPSNLRLVTTPLTTGGENAAMVSILDTELGKGLILMPQAKMAMPFEFSDKNDATSPELDPLYWVDTIVNYKGKVKTLEPRWVNNVLTTGYEIYESGMTITLWVDQENHLPVNIRLMMDELDGQSPFEFEADVQFNQMLDQTLFSLQPTQGYQIKSED